MDGSNLRARLRASLTSAMRARDATAVAALRATIAALDNAEAVELPAAPPPGENAIAYAVDGLGAAEAPRRVLTEDDMMAIVRTEIAERAAAADDCERAGRIERAARLRAEVAAVEVVVDG